MTITRRRPSEKVAFSSISQGELPQGRRGKHHAIVSRILSEVEELKEGRALKVPLSELPDSKANIRSALSRTSKQRNLEIVTSSDDEHLYVWKSGNHNGKL